MCSLLYIQRGCGETMGNLLSKLNIKTNIHVCRAEQRITQQQLADEVGVTRATIISIEKGKYNPSLELAFRVARFFKKDIQEIFSVEENNEQ
jgi:putative transcriptional regulator